MADNRLPMEVAAPQYGSVKMRQAAVEASATYIRGAVLVLNGGELEEGGVNPTGIIGVAIHKHPPTNNTSESGRYVPASPDMEFEASIDTSASPGTGAVAQTDLGARYGITEDGDGVWYVDKNKTADADVRVVVTKLVDDVGEVLGRVRCAFLANSDLGGTPIAVTIYGGSV